ncbi:aspartyl/asparaginyl beta-hydroxylase domain-containing protein [Streptomyces sp. NPDC059918]|uniref:aspartyl/asparaginyl beta-hydroxylase domain-containing protein n=1 Tax=unclassified Streptomyces TaxID=2593676 RepID=UPI0036672DD8
MPAWVGDSRPYLDQWIEEQRVDRTQLTRIIEGLESSALREPSQETNLQRPEVIIPGLAAKPWWDAGEFPWVADLEASYDAIREEFEAVGGLEATEAVRHPNSTNLAKAGRWNAYYFHLLGKKFPEHLAACPETVKALSALDGVSDSGMCYFSIMAPSTHVAPHCGFINARVRCHLALVAPKGGRMRVGTEERSWVEGKAFLFDDSFDHEVWNDSPSGRAVLLFDVWHPDLTEIEKRALAHMMTVWKTILYTDN